MNTEHIVGCNTGRLSSSQKFRTTAVYSRPRRIVLPKTAENFTCLSWHEQHELNKALYASLRTDCLSTLEDDTSPKSDCPLPAVVSSNDGRSFPSGVNHWLSVSSAANGLELTPAQRKFATVDLWRKRQRNCGLSKKVTMKKAKTEDFLTYLCVREVSCADDDLPSHSDLLNASFNECSDVIASPAISIGRELNNWREEIACSKDVVRHSHSLQLSKYNGKVNNGVKPKVDYSMSRGVDGLPCDQVAIVDELCETRARKTSHREPLFDETDDASPVKLVVCCASFIPQKQSTDEDKISNNKRFNDVTTNSAVSLTSYLQLTTDSKEITPAANDYNIASRVIMSRNLSTKSNYLIKAPTYCPSDELFEEPISYIELLHPTVTHYGMCRIKPPSGWLPHCQISDNIRFVSQLQHIHKLRDQNSAYVHQLSDLKNHLQPQGIFLDQMPCISGVEVDLLALSDAVRKCGGLNTVVRENKWSVVADMSRIVKSNRDWSSCLFELYCRYLLSYDSLETRVKQQKALETKGTTSDCFFRGKSRTLGEFATIAHNVGVVHCNQLSSPRPEHVEELYWRYVSEQNHRVVVQSGQLCSTAFPTHPSSPHSQHGWNFNVLDGNKSCLLRQYFSVDITSPRLNFAMMFTTKCWSRSCHFLPCLHYLHKGADIIWYCVAASETDKFKQVVVKLTPTLVDIDFAGDSSRVMLSPLELVANGINVTRIVQHSGQYVYISPGCFTACVATGFCVSETIHFATSAWLQHGSKAAQLLRSLLIADSFSMSKLLCSIALNCDKKEISRDLLEQALPLMKSLFQRESELQSFLVSLGLPSSATGHDEHIRCDICKMLCFLSMVVSEQDDVIYCLEHAVDCLQHDEKTQTYKLFYQFTESELQQMLRTVERCLNTT